METGSLVGAGGRYRIEAELGRGGMGSVHRAHDVTLDRPVAIKFLREGLADDPAYRRRLEREARIMAGLAHPNLVRVFDAELDARPPFLVIELLEGVPLSRVIEDGGAMTPEAVRRLMAELGDALAYLHGRRILHRDLKPANVFILPDGSARLLDFGLARPLEGTRLTGEGIPVGTLPYMAPEMVRGEEAGAPADVYGLGMTLLTAATGHLPFDEGAPVAQVAACIASHRGEPSFVPATLEPDLRRALCAMLHGDAAQRPAAGSRLPAPAVRRGRASPPSPSPAPAGPPRRRPPRTALGVLVLLLLALAGVGVLRRGPAPPPLITPPPSPVLPAPPQPDPPDLDDAELAALVRRLSDFQPLTITEGVVNRLTHDLGDIVDQFAANRMRADALIMVAPSRAESRRLRRERLAVSQLMDARLEASPLLATLRRAEAVSPRVLGARSHPFEARQRFYEALVPLVELALFAEQYRLSLTKLPRPELGEFGPVTAPMSDPDETIEVLGSGSNAVILGSPSPLTGGRGDVRLAFGLEAKVPEDLRLDRVELSLTGGNFPAAAVAVSFNGAPPLFARGNASMPRWSPQTVVLSVPPQFLRPGTNDIRLSWTPGLDRRALLADTNPVSRVLLRLQGADGGK